MAAPNIHRRIRSKDTIDLFTRVFGATGPEARGSESDRLQLVPLVFGLLPVAALVRADPNQRIKPAIRDHLIALNIEASDALVDTIKEIADQYHAAVLRAPADRPRKFGIESVRALRSGAYSEIRTRQQARCAVCGVVFGRDTGETLDHIIPWSLVGDRFDGSNWQLLCGSCNLGKREWLSALQSAQALSWHYGIGDMVPAMEPTLEARYVALAVAGGCQADACRVRARDDRLVVVRRHVSGLAVVDNLVVLCSNHVSATVSPPETSPSAPPPPVVPTVEGERREPPPAAPYPTVPLSTPFAGYLLGGRVSGGGMAESFLAVDEETGEEVFLKRAVDESGDGRALQREAQIYQKLHLRYAEHIPRVVNAGRQDGYYYLVTERAESDLERHVAARGRLPTPEAKAILRELIEALRELHGMDIVHRDLKPSNVLRLGERWLLADFGISKDQRSAAGGGTFQMRGTTGYAAPEQILTGVEARPPADVFALGKIMVFLITGGTDVDGLVFKQWRKAARWCTEDDADSRPTLDQVVEALESIDE